MKGKFKTKEVNVEKLFLGVSVLFLLFYVFLSSFAFKLGYTSGLIIGALVILGITAVIKDNYKEEVVREIEIEE